MNCYITTYISELFLKKLVDGVKCAFFTVQSMDP